jgi:integrase
LKVKDLYELVRRDYVMNDKTSLRTCHHHFRPVLARFGELDAESLTTADVERYQFDRLSQGKARQTINNEVGYLRRGYKLAIRLEKLLKAPHIINLRVQNARSGFLKVEEFHRLKAALDALSPVVGEMLLWFYGIGWRSKEVMALAWDECDQEEGMVSLPARRSKTRTPRRIKLPPELHASLRRRWLQRNGPFVFHRDGKPVKSIRSVWDRARKAVGKPNLYIHDLRRSWATNAIQAGLSQKLCMQIGGWKTVSTFLRYCIVDEEEIEQALTRVADFNKGKPKSAP